MQISALFLKKHEFFLFISECEDTYIIMNMALLLAGKTKEQNELWIFDFLFIPLQSQRLTL